MKVGRHVFSCRSLPLSTTVLNDLIFSHYDIRTYSNVLKVQAEIIKNQTRLFVKGMKSKVNIIFKPDAHLFP